MSNAFAPPLWRPEQANRRECGTKNTMLLAAGQSAGRRGGQAAPPSRNPPLQVPKNPRSGNLTHAMLPA